MKGWKTASVQEREYGACVTNSSFDRDPTNDKHNFVSFDSHKRSFHYVFLSPESTQHVFIDPVAIMCMIIPQTEKH